MIADAKQVVPNKPFFMHFCPGAQHAPHHVPKECADKYKGKFDKGWDAYRKAVLEKQKALGLLSKDATLSRHDPDVQDRDTLSADERKLYARMTEVFAGLLAGDVSVNRDRLVAGTPLYSVASWQSFACHRSAQTGEEI